MACRRPVILCILDGWGYRSESSHNAIALARTPVFDRLWYHKPHSLIRTSGLDVGLPQNHIGNSEVGHLTLGAGRVIWQNLVKITQAIRSGELDRHPLLTKLVAHLTRTRGTCHVIGLISPGGVHAHQEHLIALSRIVSEQGIPVVVHGIMDGRDVAPLSGREQMVQFLSDSVSFSGVRVGTVSGRYYAMDRDRRWDRTEKAYQVMVNAQGDTRPDPLQVIDESYARGISDEFIIPSVIEGYHGMVNGDGLLVGNFRSDRVRQLLMALVDPWFDTFSITRRVAWAAAVGMVEYSDSLNEFIEPLFSRLVVDHGIGQIVAEAGLTQLRIAETEKYPHVTYFFNGGQESCLPGESRILISSPKVATYDLHPQMSAQEITDKLINAVASKQYDFIVINYANPDMVGHTGRVSAAIAAVETVDHCLGQLESSIEHSNEILLITADHGNCEQMYDAQTGGPHTAHTLSLVPVILVNGPRSVRSLHSPGCLSDIAPTLLDLLSLESSAEMTGRSLLVR